MEPVYKYQALRDDVPEIRILELKATKRAGEPLKCRLRHADLRTAEYAALSYSWGMGKNEQSTLKIKEKKTFGESLRVKLLCGEDTKTFPIVINSNLARALRSLRRRDRSVYLWNDKLCINQDDGAEKARQIPLMRDIYTHATMVHAWLGPSCDEYDRIEDERSIRNVHTAFELAARIWAKAQVVQSVRKPSSEREWLGACFAMASGEPTRQQALPGYLPQDPEKTQHRGSEQDASVWTEFARALRTAVRSDVALMQNLPVFLDLSDLKWFSRIWILQEYGRARSLTFHYGTLQSEHLPIFLALSLANSLRHTDDTLGFRSSMQDLDKRFLACLTARTTCTEQITVDEVLQAAFNSPPPTHEATDPRDLIHARLGLASDQVAYPRDITRRFSAGDGATDPSPARVFASVAQHLLSTGLMDHLVIFKPYDFLRGPPDHLLAEGAEKWKQDLAKDWVMPSWAYEWSKDGLHTFSRYDACNSTKSRASFVQHPSALFGEALVMSGTTIGSIHDHSRRFSEYVLEAELGIGAVAHSDLHTDIQPLSEEQRSKLGTSIAALHQELGLSPSWVDVERLFGVHDFPAAGFWCWWIAWVAELKRLSGLSRPRQNIAEVLFRQASAKLQRDIGVVEDVFGTTGDLASLTDLQRWSGLLVSENARRRAVGIELAETFFRSAWGMRVAILDTGRLCYVPEDSSRQDAVVVFHGVKAPLVLHGEEADGDAYGIVGPAHIVGGMRGELMKGARQTEEYTIV